MRKKEAIKELNHFTGTTQYHKGWAGVKWTDGVAFLAQNVAGWLVTDCSSYNLHPKVKNEPFVTFKLKESGDKWVLNVEDGNINVLVKQEYEVVDLPKGTSITMFMADKVLMLSTEY